MSNALRRGFMYAHLLGRVGVARQYARELKAEEPATFAERVGDAVLAELDLAEDATAPLDAVLDKFAGQLALTREAYDALTEGVRRNAWYVSGVQEEYVIEQAKQSLYTALDAGTGRKGFIDGFGERLGANAETVFTPAHAEVVWRTNAASMYNAGREKQLLLPEVRNFFTLWAYYAILDTRTTEICRRLSEFIAPPDDPRWRWCIPPNHYNCRSSFEAINSYRAEREGLIPHGWEGDVEIDAAFATSPLAFVGLDY